MRVRFPPPAQMTGPRLFELRFFIVLTLICLIKGLPGLKDSMYRHHGHPVILLIPIQPPPASKLSFSPLWFPNNEQITMILSTPRLFYCQNLDRLDLRITGIKKVNRIVIMVIL